jgi:protein-S-isoprenylcysteine O-methyltransferase Ste14
LLGLVFGVAFGYRIHVEEKTLAKELGSEYTEYMRRTKRLIPYLF